MQPQVYDAIKRAYIDTRNYEDPNYLLVSVETVKEIVRELTETCGLNVTAHSDSENATSYLLLLNRAGFLPLSQTASDPAPGKSVLPTLWFLLLRISWLGPFAMGVWSRFERKQPPRFRDHSEPETARDPDVETCVDQVLRRHGIRILTEDELEEEFAVPGLTWEDDGVRNVRHLLFARDAVRASHPRDRQRQDGTTNIQLQIPEKDLPAFLAYLGIGTLYAIRTGVVSPDTGIWTLARPNVWEFLLKRPKIPREIIQVFQTADELSAIKTLLPDEFDQKVGELIKQLERELARMLDPTWSIQWSLATARPALQMNRRKNRKRPNSAMGKKSKGG